MNDEKIIEQIGFVFSTPCPQAETMLSIGTFHANA